MSELLITLPGGALDLLGRRVLRHGEPVKLEPRAWRVLEKLARSGCTPDGLRHGTAN